MDARLRERNVRGRDVSRLTRSAVSVWGGIQRARLSNPEHVVRSWMVSLTGIDGRMQSALTRDCANSGGRSFKSAPRNWTACFSPRRRTVLYTKGSILNRADMNSTRDCQ